MLQVYFYLCRVPQITDRINGNNWLISFASFLMSDANTSVHQTALIGDINVGALTNTCEVLHLCLGYYVEQNLSFDDILVELKQDFEKLSVSYDNYQHSFEDVLF